MARVLIVVAFMSFAVTVMASGQNLLGDSYCSQITVCERESHCCSPTTCCPDYTYCCGDGRQCCRLANSLLVSDKFPATEAIATMVI